MTSTVGSEPKQGDKVAFISHHQGVRFRVHANWEVDGFEVVCVTVDDSSVNLVNALPHWAVGFMEDEAKVAWNNRQEREETER